MLMMSPRYYLQDRHFFPQTRDCRITGGHRVFLPASSPPRYATSSKTTPRSKETGELPADVETIQRHQQRQQPPINISRKPVVPKLWSGGHLGVVELWFKWPHAKPEVLYQLISALRPICSPLTSTFHVRLHI